MDAPRLIYSTEPLDETALRPARGARVLFVLADDGNVAQEVFKTSELLARHGCAVTFATLRGGSAGLDFIGGAIAVCEMAWDSTARFMQRAARAGTLRALPSLDDLRAADSSLDFDALVVVGGHGSVYGRFVRDALLHATVHAFYGRGCAIGLLCHSPFLLTLMEEDGRPISAGRLVTCWPRSYERLLGALPFLGPLFKPFGSTVGEALERAGARVHDRGLPARRVHAAVDGVFVTGRGPWSTTAFTLALLGVLAKTRESVPAEQH